MPSWTQTGDEERLIRISEINMSTALRRTRTRGDMTQSGCREGFPGEATFELKDDELVCQEELVYKSQDRGNVVPVRSSGSEMYKSTKLKSDVLECIAKCDLPY